MSSHFLSKSSEYAIITTGSPRPYAIISSPGEGQKPPTNQNQTTKKAVHTMNAISINSKKHTIEMTKAYAKLASRVGSEEYKSLQAARRDYPGYTVITKSSTRKSPIPKGLTYDFMEQYITAHDGKDGEVMSEYQKARGDLKKYAEICNWFLTQYPAVKRTAKNPAA